MTPTLPPASGTSNGAGQSSSGAPSAPGSTTPTTDFLSLLTQATGQPTQQVMSSIAGANAAASLQAEADTDAIDGDALEALGLMPLSLPMFAADTRSAIANGVAEALQGTQVLGMKQGGPALDLQMLTEMIESEQATSREGVDGLETFHLPTPAESAQSGKTSTTDPTARPVHVPVGNARWADEIGSRLTMMAEQGKSSASLRLSPEHLGPLEIRIAVRDDQASVWFGAAHADTRAAIEHALPRLRELFEAQGMTLADAGVSHEAPREHHHVERNAGVAADGDSATVAEASAPVRVSVGLLDAYA